MLISVHGRPPPSVTWADRDGWVSADAREPRRMRPHLSPAGPAGRCQQRGPHPAARTAPDRPSPSRAGRSARPGEPRFRSHGVTGGGAWRTRTQHRTPIICGQQMEFSDSCSRSDHADMARGAAPRNRVLLAAALSAGSVDAGREPAGFSRARPAGPGIAGLVPPPA
jgi:hypothetical protein